LAQWEQFEKEENKKEGRQNEKKALTLTGLLMEGRMPTFLPWETHNCSFW
jgi:hypothetical protein